MPSQMNDALGQSEAFLRFQESLSRVAPVDRPVIIIGERGTGKELAARRLHYLSRRWDGPLVELNCAALSPTLIESELFGYEAGAFTGATTRGRTGRFEAANAGTLFLDELGNIPLQVQEKILRAVEYGRFERVGGSKAVETDVRIIGATNADLPALARDGRFMRDLLDRLGFEVLRLPPLRERNGDIPLLANHFAAHMANELGIGPVVEFSDSALQSLEAYAWPGNVRELKNVVERAVYRSDMQQIESIEFYPFGTSPQESISVPGEMEMPQETADLSIPIQEQVRQLEIRLTKTALQKCKYNQRAAADLLHLTYHQFRGLYRKYQNDLTA